MLNTFGGFFAPGNAVGGRPAKLGISAELTPGRRVAHDRSRHRSEVSWDDDALTFGQWCILRLPIDLGERPRRHMVGRRKSLQRITRTGRYGQAAVP
jgi:hypothetical protein